ncbi:YdbT family protein [Serinibacter arcticus]|uniref:DUF304 domain-containing protein n=1 Tax=Serinibacter arcticus TaxID=1655435 RepID=A0A4Z1DYK5_9MICO|nr:hypothetical protein [Serinibacter arcticus]TGO04596.1 hypothetical protein SERN_2189 [Serinibacter arcticus]
MPVVVAAKPRHWSDVVFVPAGLIGALVIAPDEVWWIRLLAALASIVVAGVILWVIRGWRTHAIVAIDDALELRRRFGTRSIPREQITAVRGDHPTRQRWSTRAFVEVGDDRVELPLFLDVKAADVVERLQEWHGSAPADGDAPPPSPPSPLM